MGRALESDYFREKKIGKFRIYYLIYKECIIVYMVTISEKKDQQRTINTIRLFLDKYREDVEEWIERNETH